MDAAKHKIGPEAIAGLFGRTGNVLVAKGQKILTFDRAAKDLDAAAFAAAVNGPSGNLRAPTLRFGNVWLVGFHADLYARLSP